MEEREKLVKIIKTVKIKNSLGLHIRPATTIVKSLQTKESNVYFSYNNMTINAKSILSILTLVAKKNAKIKITVEGEDAKITMDALLNAFEKGFGEEE